MDTRYVRLAMLGVGLAGAMVLLSGDVLVKAQEANRAEDAAVRLAGRKIHVDKSTGKLRELSQQEARELVATLTAMTTRSERTAEAPGGAALVQLNGFDHVLVGRPNADGTTDVECVSSVDAAVSFLAQQPKSNGQE
ncbi:MAG TPA: hypothetical protein VKE51_08315 [Vicinamibacterales bacterium]|nr:hypothetical protein [Vicinamibacterales bacterium]